MQRYKLFAIVAITALAIGSISMTYAAADKDNNDRDENKIGKTATEWINYLGFLSGDTSTTVSYNGVNSGVGSGLPGLIVQSSTVGDNAVGGGNKVISTGLQVSPNAKVQGVKVCYESANGTRTYIDQIRIAQLNTTSSPAFALVKLDSLQSGINGPQCVSTSPPVSISQNDGQLTLDLRIKTGNTADKIVIRGVALDLVK